MIVLLRQHFINYWLFISFPPLLNLYYQVVNTKEETIWPSINLMAEVILFCYAILKTKKKTTTTSPHCHFLSCIHNVDVCKNKSLVFIGAISSSRVKCSHTEQKALGSNLAWHLDFVTNLWHLWPPFIFWMIRLHDSLSKWSKSACKARHTECTEYKAVSVLKSKEYIQSSFLWNIFSLNFYETS